MINMSYHFIRVIVHGRWFSSVTPASFTTKTGRHDIAEIGIKHQKSNQIIKLSNCGACSKQSSLILY